MCPLTADNSPQNAFLLTGTGTFGTGITILFQKRPRQAVKRWKQTKAHPEETRNKQGVLFRVLSFLYQRILKRIDGEPASPLALAYPDTRR
jgi:hypothetical protein